MTLLELDGLQAGYETGQVLFDVNLEVGEEEIVSILGRNGAGKTTTMRAIMGADLPRVHGGAIRFNGRDLLDMQSHEIAQAGISYVPEERELFPRLTVTENIHLAATTVTNPLSEEEMFDIFPPLADMRGRAAKNLSGGEQQMLAIARALVARPELILLDEPFEGLAPMIVRRVEEAIERINDERDVTVLMVEQNVAATLAVAKRHYLLDEGRVVDEVTSERLREDEELRQRYLGV